VDSFDPPARDGAAGDDSVAWVRVSPRLATVRRITLLATWVPLTLVAVVALASTGLRTAAIGVAFVATVTLGWGWVLIGRTVRSWGYAERADDLLVTRGVLRRALVVVPYGRMQFVDVTAGPLDRKFGLATVQLHTAAAATDASIPGLVPAEAARLRDRLAARGEATAAGL